MPVATPPGVVTIKNIFQHCQVSPGGQKSPWVKTHSSNCTQCPSACKENGTVSSIGLGHSQHNIQASRRRAPAEQKQASVGSAVSVPFNCKFGQALLSEVQNASCLGH